MTLSFGTRILRRSSHTAVWKCIAAGELAPDGQTFFARRVLSYLPNQHQRQFRAPLRRIEYLNDYALYRDGRRKVEIYIDRALLRSAGIDLESVEASHRPEGRHRGTFVESGSITEWR